MELIYKKYRGKQVKYPDCEVTICGFNDDHLIGATTTKALASFRKTNKDTYIEEKYKNIAFRYLYIDENTVLKQYPKIK